MRNHIIFKFIAILLCAASLVGVIGSASGLFILTELDLFDKTVEEVRNEQNQRGSEYYAGEVALRYASTTLGGCPEELVSSFYGAQFDTFYETGKYSYRLLDAEGNEVYKFGELEEVSASYSYPVTGQYLHMVSMETASEQETRLRAQAASYGVNFTIGETVHLMDALSPEGALISYATFCDANGKIVYEGYHENGIGFLYYNQNGNVSFSGSRHGEDLPGTVQKVAGAYFQAMDGSVVYEATGKDGVGSFYINASGYPMFAEGDIEIPEPAAVEAEEESLPPEETEPETMEEETVAADILPVFYAAFYNEEEEKFYRVRSGSGVGFLSVNQEGHLVFRGVQFETTQIPDDTIITGTYFCDAEDRVVFELYAEENIGTITYTENNQLVFTTAEPVTNFDPAASLEEEDDEETSSASDIPTEPTAADSEDTAEAAETTETAEQTAPTEATESTEAAQVPDETIAVQPAAARTADVPTEINGKPLEEYQVETFEYYDHNLDEHVFVRYVHTPMPEYTVELNLASGALGMDSEYQLLMMIRSVSQYLLPALGICLLVFAICTVYLCCAAGRKPGSTEVHAGGLNCMSLDLYAALAFAGITGAIVIISEVAYYRLNQNFLFSCILAVAMAFAACLILVAFCFAFVAQIKTPDGYWWRNSLCGHFVRMWFRFAKWLQKVLCVHVFPALGKIFLWLWKSVVLGFFQLWQRFANWFLRITRRAFRKLRHGIHRFLSLLPITWQWLLAGLIIIFVAALTLSSYNGSTVILGLLVIIGIILYCAHCYGVLSESAKRMSHGDLDIKVDDNLMVGCFKDFAADLNNLADVAMVAAQKQLKSERMKTELITNVSHDIKTPLTSIINYVDLLQKPHSDEEQVQYLEVLDRQSLRLKKLIEDLMDMSKASTGNMVVEITTVDAVESVNQALGEFADKLTAARLTPMFRHPDNRVAMRADGRLVWRVLSNVLSNAVKYAMPGTRLYVDLMELEGKVVISLKNISREELNMDADELMERFVRGDDSRNTEGSGLGLNIAKSLMELQKGQLQLLVDGDLFKVTLIFPGV